MRELKNHPSPDQLDSLLNTRMNAHPLIQYCFVRDLTAQYKQDYLALENAYLIQIAE